MCGFVKGDSECDSERRCVLHSGMRMNKLTVTFSTSPVQCFAEFEHVAAPHKSRVWTVSELQV